jgi:hypothetical protein
MHKSLAFLAVLALPTSAYAEDAAKTLATEIEPFYQLWPTMRDDPGSRATALDSDPQPADCDAAIARARKAGLKDDARIYVRSYISGLDETHYDDKREAYVLLGDAAAMCTQWRKLVLLAPAARIQTETAQSQKTYDTVDPVSLGASMGQAFIDAGKKCLDVTDKAIKAGAPADYKVKMKDVTLSIGEGRAKICQASIDWANSLGAKIKEAHAADREKRAAPYKALGVSGAKLDLFLEYDDVYWRGGRDCQIISDLKQLAKAKALFHWLENADGTHTIRKYTFNGNKVGKPVSKTYKNAVAAQRGCK